MLSCVLYCQVVNTKPVAAHFAAKELICQKKAMLKLRYLQDDVAYVEHKLCATVLTFLTSVAISFATVYFSIAIDTLSIALFCRSSGISYTHTWQAAAIHISNLQLNYRYKLLSSMALATRLNSKQTFALMRVCAREAQTQ
jgi:hypothetical protein